MRDPAATIRFDDVRVVRELTSSLSANHFLRSDLAKSWVADGRLIEFSASGPDVLHSRRIEFVTHPFEWCDAQLLHAGRLTLSLQREAVEAGHDLKDASAWNIVFDGCKPVFCDLLSFVSLQSRKWWAMGQFVRHFVLPLLLSRRRGLRSHECFAIWRDGVSVLSARRLLGSTVYLTRHAPLFFGASEATSRALHPVEQSENASRHSIAAFRNSLHVAIEWMLAGAIPPAVAGRTTSSQWAFYEQERPHYGSSLERKQSTVALWLQRIAPTWAADFGCNTGEFSRMAATQGAHVVAVDADHDSIQRLFLRSCGYPRLYPLVANLEDLCGGRGWRGAEHLGLMQRMEQRFDLVMMLALLHHLAIGAAIPLSEVAAFAYACTRDHVIVEFIGEADPQLVSLCEQRQRLPAEFSLVRQRSAFLAAGFDLEAEVDLSPAHRSLALLRKRSR